MSLETILAAIQSAGQEQVNKIRSAAQAQVDEILDRAQAEMLQIREQASSQASAPAFRERSRLLHQARMEALRTIGDAREQYIEAVLEQTRAHLVAIRDNPIYAPVLKNLIQQACDELECSMENIHNATIEIDPRDQGLVEGILAEMNLNLRCSPSLKSWGGVTVKSEADRIVIINTLEARMASATPYLRRYLATLFENQECLHTTMGTPVYAH